MAHHYETRLTTPRLVLFGVYSALSVLPLGFMEIWLTRAGSRGVDLIARLVLALATGALSALLFARMAVTPGLLVSAALVCSAAYRFGDGRRSRLATLGFETFLVGWLGAVGSALY